MLPSLPMWAFVKSVLFGALAGAAPILAITCLFPVMAIFYGWHDFLWSLWLAILPLVVSLPLVLGASVFIGLPLTAFLQYKGWEREGVYVAVGAIAGFLLPIAVLMLLSAPSGYWTAILGAISGAVTANSWWVYGRRPHLEE